MGDSPYNGFAAAWIWGDPSHTLGRVNGKIFSTPRLTLRRLPLWLVALGALFTLTCGEVTSYAFTEDAETFVRGSSSEEPLNGNLDFGGFEALNLPDDEQLTRYGVATNQINTIDVSSLVLEFAEGSEGDDLSFLTNVTFYAEAPGLEPVKIATRERFGVGERVVELTPEPADLKAHALTRAMRITNHFEGQRPPLHVTLKATLTLEVHVQLKEALCGGSQ